MPQTWVGTPGIDSVAIFGPRPWADVRAYGAKGDGVTDDTAAIQAALDSLPVGSADPFNPDFSAPGAGGVVYIPAGHYRLTTNVLLRRDYITLRGAGPSSSVLDIRANTAAIAIPQKTASLNYRHLRIKDLGIWGDKATYPNSIGIAIDNAWELDIGHVKVFNVGSGIYSAGVTPTSDGVYLYHVYVQDCKNYQFRFYGIGQIQAVNCYAISMKSSAGPDGFVIDRSSSVRMVNCIADGNRYGWVVTSSASGSPVQDGHLLGCRAYGGRRGLDFSGYVTDFKVIGSTIGGNIEYQGIFIAVTAPQTMARVQFLANNVWGQTDAAIFLDGDGTLTDVRFTENHFSGSGGPVFNEASFSGTKTRFVFARNQGFATENSGATSIADGGTIAHGLVAAPTKVRVTPTVAGEMASVTAVGATTFTVALKTHAGAAGTTQTVYWEAEV